MISFDPDNNCRLLGCVEFAVTVPTEKMRSTE